jgi:hypothetical protein
MAADVKDPQYWRSRKEEVLGRAESIEREETKRILLRIADDYDRIAKMVERQRDREQK